jgi:hypothetical protein
MPRRRLVNLGLGVRTNASEIPAGFLKIGVYQSIRDAIHRSARDDMADLTTPQSKQMPASGLAGVFGLFAGLCAIFVACATFSDWHSGMVSRIHSDLVLLTIAGAACVALLALAKYLRVREARRASGSNHAGGGGFATGIGFAAMGLLILGSTLYAAAHADPFAADNLMGVPASLMFVFAGILMALPAEYVRWRSFLATLVMTCFALTFDWVAFGPGERKFSGNIGGFGYISSELTGRIMFGFFAVILDVCAIVMWIGQFRQAWMRSPNASDSTT